MAVEPLRVDGVQPADATTQVGLRRLYQQPVFSLEQTVGKACPARLRHLPAEQQQKLLAVAVFEEDRLSGVAARADVVERARILKAQGSRHDAIMLAEAAGDGKP